MPFLARLYRIFIGLMFVSGGVALAIFVYFNWYYNRLAVTNFFVGFSLFILLVVLIILALRYAGLMWFAYLQQVEHLEEPLETYVYPMVTVIVPAYNEGKVLDSAVEQLMWLDYPRYEVIVVDDGSTDETAAVAEAAGAHVLRQVPNQGKGAAIRRGFGETTQPFVVVQDADLEYDPADYETLLAPLLAGEADVVFGSRFMGGQPHRVLYFWHSVGNRFLTLLSNAFTNLNLTDMETGYKVFRRELLEDMPLRSNRFGIEPELTAKFARRKARIYEVPISYHGRTYEQGKKIGWKDGIAALWAIVRFNLAD